MSTNSTEDVVQSPDGEKKEEAFNYDDILEHIGQMGPSQLCVCLLLFIPCVMPGIAVMTSTFTGAIPQYECALKDCENVTGDVWTLFGNSTGVKDTCHRFSANLTDDDQRCRPHYIDDVVDPTLLEPCDSWIYSTDMFETTIISEFDLTCDNEWKVTLASSVYMIGMFVGGLGWGNIADTIGRKLAFTINCFVLAVAMTATAFVPDYVTYCILRFITGVSGMGQFLIVFVWGVEATGKKYRTLIGCLYQAFFSLGSILLGVVAYYVRSWRALHLILGLPMFLPLVFYWLPESTRWLITKKRFDEARKVIEKAAKMNKKCVPEHLLIDQSVKEIDGSGADEDHGPQQSENLIQIFRTRVLCVRIVVMSFAWIAVCMSFFGISFSSGNLSGSFFLNYELLMLVEVPSHFGSIYFMGKIGRRPTLCGGLLISGFACLAGGLVPQDPAGYQIACSLIGKMFATISFDVVFSYTSELFPTNSRSSAVGLCSTAGRIGSILAPIIANMGRTLGPEVPFIIFAVINIIVGVVCLILPETNNLPLPATIEQAKNISANNRGCFRCDKS